MKKEYSSQLELTNQPRDDVYKIEITLQKGK
jgi:hypothetical protein